MVKLFISEHQRYMRRYNLKGNSHLYYSVPCPYCGAEKGKPCHRNSGHWYPPHVERIRRTWQAQNTKHHIFVYGTLKRGFSNHTRLLSKAEFLGEAVSVDRDYQMIAHGVPFLAKVAPGGIGLPVKGELFAVTGQEFAACDRLEGHPHNYCRKEHMFQLPNGKQIKAWVYLCPHRFEYVGSKQFLIKPTNGFIEWRPNW